MITVRNLSKVYTVPKIVESTFKNLFNFEKLEISALDDVSFNAKNNEKLAIIGLNGSGKSTLIKCLTGLIAPTKGVIDVMGFNPFRDRKKYVSNIGVLFGQKSSLIFDLTLGDCLKLYKAIYQIRKPDFNERLQNLNNYIGFESFLNQPVRKLSFGQRMRAEILLSVLHYPKICFFDEPTIGLDVEAKSAFRDFLFSYNFNESMVVLISHDLELIDNICNRLIILDKGKIVFDGTSKTLLNSQKYETLTIELGRSVSEINDCYLTHRDFLETKKDNRLIYKIPKGSQSIIHGIQSNILKYTSINSSTLSKASFEECVKNFLLIKNGPNN